MTLKKPGKVLLTQVPLKSVAERTGGGGRKPVDTSIMLIPFIDFLIVLVVFLLSTMGQEAVARTPDVALPSADHVVELAQAPIISISRSTVLLDGRRVADTTSLLRDATVERIEPLVQDLETLRANWRVLHPEQAFPNTAVIMADRDVDYRVLKKVMFSTAQAGYPNLSFAVNRGEG